MLKRRRHVLLLTLPAVAAALAVGVWLLWPRTAITRDNATKIQPGMTLAAVEAILYGPARDETTAPVTADLDESEPEALARRAKLYQLDMKLAVIADWGHRRLTWQSDYVMIAVAFDPDERVTECISLPMRRVSDSPLAMLRRWLALWRPTISEACR
jgi:hypothetical protein